MAVIGVVGLGVMGLGIAQVFASAGHQVLATDGQARARDTAISRLRDGLAKRVASGKMTADALDDMIAHLEVTHDLTGLAPCDLVIEAIAEMREAKHGLFSELESIIRPDAVLATNTSSLSVTAIAAGLVHPGRVLGLHFFNPAPVMKLVELVATPKTDEVALTLAREVTEEAGKVVVACADRPGFIVNRCARPYYGEALALLEEGISAAAIDGAMLAAGYRLGPFALIDLIGADINLAASEGLNAAMGGHPRYHVFESLRAQVARGDLGRKTGKGFVTDTEVVPLDDGAIALRIEAALANEAASLLEEGGVAIAAIDTALKLGLNFPRGAFEAARARGLGAVRAELTRLEASAPAHLKGRYRISPALEAMT